MEETENKPSGEHCFCCGTPVEKIAEPKHFRRKWRIKCLAAMVIGLAAMAVSIVLWRGTIPGGVCLGYGVGTFAMGLILIDKFPKLRDQQKT